MSETGCCHPSSSKSSRKRNPRVSTNLGAIHTSDFFIAYVLGCRFAQALAIVLGITVSIWPRAGFSSRRLLLRVSIQLAMVDAGWLHGRDVRAVRVVSQSVACRLSDLPRQRPLRGCLSEARRSRMWAFGSPGKFARSYRVCHNGRRRRAAPERDGGKCDACVVRRKVANLHGGNIIASLPDLRQVIALIVRGALSTAPYYTASTSDLSRSSRR